MAIRSFGSRSSFAPSRPRATYRSGDARRVRTAITEPARLGHGLDFLAERERVDAWLARELEHSALVVPEPRDTVIQYAPRAWQWWRMMTVAVVAALVLAFAALPRPLVQSTWNESKDIVGAAHIVETVPYSGPAIVGPAAPQP
jgi:hypothetical protein